jgi:tRNA threonylcarbamoyladenosine biosynthesis protein TsaB
MSQDPFVLAIDAAGAACSAAVAAGERLLAAERVESAHGQAEQLMPLIERTMRRAGLAAADLDLIAATVGPGSFTGLRAGLAAARGIALASGRPLFGVTGFAAVAAGPAVAAADRTADTDYALLVALESRREDLYAQLFDRLRQPCGAPFAVMPAGLAEAVEDAIGAMPLRIAGDAAGRAAAALTCRPSVSLVADSAPDATGVWRAALARWRQGVRADGARPLYLRPPGVTLPKDAGP